MDRTHRATGPLSPRDAVRTRPKRGQNSTAIEGLEDPLEYDSERNMMMGKRADTEAQNAIRNAKPGDASIENAGFEF